MLIDFVPTVAGVSLAEAPAFKKAPGGAPANVAVGIARLGGNSAFVGKVINQIVNHFFDFWKKIYVVFLPLYVLAHIIFLLELKCLITTCL